MMYRYEHCCYSRPFSGQMRVFMKNSPQLTSWVVKGIQTCNWKLEYLPLPHLATMMLFWIYIISNQVNIGSSKELNGKPQAVLNAEPNILMH